MLMGGGGGYTSIQLVFLQFSLSWKMPISNLFYAYIQADDSDFWMFCFPFKEEKKINITKMGKRYLLMLLLLFHSQKQKRNKKNPKWSQWDYFDKYYCFPERKNNFLFITKLVCSLSCNHKPSSAPFQIFQIIKLFFSFCHY